MAIEAKTQILQAFLDLQKLGGEWFDEVESGKLTITKAKLAELSALIRSLDAVYKNLALEYITSGVAADDMLGEMRASLGPRREAAAKRIGRGGEVGHDN